MNGKAAMHADLLAADETFVPETISVSLEFHVELENWPDGIANVWFTEGPLMLRNPGVLLLRGSGSKYHYGSLADPPRLLVSFGAVHPVTGDTVQLWVGTRLRGPGTVSLGRMGVPSMHDYRGWENDFAGGYVDGQLLESVSGQLELETYEEEIVDSESNDIRWGIAKGRVDVEFDLQDQSEGGTARSKATIAFVVPVGFTILVCQSAESCSENRESPATLRSLITHWRGKPSGPGRLRSPR